jgi:folate-binding protein YgfZ
MGAPPAAAAGLDVLQTGAAVTPLADRVLLRVRGEDRVRFLQGMLANDVASLAPGAGTYALLLTEQGRVVADLRVLSLDDEIRLDVGRDRADAVREALDRFLVADDVEIEAQGDTAIAVRGPASAAVVSAVAGADLHSLPEGSHAPLAGFGEGARAARFRDVGVDGFVLWSSPDAASALVVRLRDAGAEAVDAATVEILRVARGWAREGVDFDEKTLAPEVPSLARAISYRKGCYLGQEVVERVAARGHVNWLVMRLEGKGTPPPIGAAVRENDAEIGRVSSSTSSGPGSFSVIARMRRTAATVGTALLVGEGDSAVEVRVAETPAP